LKSKHNKKFYQKKGEKKNIFSIARHAGFLLNGGKYLKKDFFVHKNMKRKFLEILFSYLRARRKTFLL
jgi:hypothetical protein